jgi:hypothetical protein
MLIKQMTRGSHISWILPRLVLGRRYSDEKISIKNKTRFHGNCNEEVSQ